MDWPEQRRYFALLSKSGTSEEQKKSIRDLLFKVNLGLVRMVTVAQWERFYPAVRATMGQDDLFQELAWKMSYCIDKFDVNRGYRFSTYACQAMYRQAVGIQQRIRRNFSAEHAFRVERGRRRGSAGLPEHEDDEEGPGVSAFLVVLDHLERRIIEMFYGLNGYGAALQIVDISRLLGLGQQWISHLKAGALLKMREAGDGFANR